MNKSSLIKNIKFSIGGLLWAMYNEFYFESLWAYSERLKPFIWKDIPLVAIIGWPVLICLLLNVSDYVQNKTPCSLGRYSLAADILIIVPIFATLEFIMSRLGFWEYKSELHQNIFGMVGGYVLAVCLFSSFCRRLGNIKKKGI